MLSQGSYQGHTALWLENDYLRITVLPEKGADICQITYKPNPIDLLLVTPAGLRPPADRPPTDFLENYEGGWQTLLPNVNDACEYRGAAIPMHGEVALLPWDWQPLPDDAAAAVRLEVRCQHTPFRLQRTMRLLQGEAALVLEDSLTNESETAAEFVWGHHLTLGSPFLEAGCQVELPAQTILTPDELFEPATARLAPGQHEPWPYALGRHGERIDLRQIPGPEVHTHDDAYLTGLDRGIFRVANPRLGLAFRLEWDAVLFRWVTFWQPFGGADAPPLTGIYGLGLEPWTSRFNLEQAIQRGQALRLGPGQSQTTALRATVELS